MLNLEETLVSLEGIADIPSVENFTCILQRCRKEKNLAYAKHVHTHICGKGLEVHKALGNYLVPMFVECGSATNAQQVFNRLIHWNEFSWTSLIEGYIESGDAQHALSLYEKMQDDHVCPSRYTLMALLKACARLKCLEKGREMHLEITKEEYESDRFIGSSLMDMYAKCGSLAEAHDVFEELPVQDVVSWTTLIAGYAEHGLAAEALECFQNMYHEGVAPDRVTYVYSLKACGMLRALERGRKLHAEIRKQGFKRDASIGSALLDMYVKCGALTLAQEVFEKLPSRDLVSWNALMAGYVEQGFNEDALNCFQKMQLEGVSPDATTFVCSLKACAGLGAIDRGREIQTEIDRKGLQSDPFVGSTLVDMYAKCGLLEEAREAFDKLPVREVVSWTALIAGYTEHGFHEEAMDCLKQMQLEGMAPDSITFMYFLKSCGSLGAIDRGQQIHAKIVEEGYDGDHRLRSSLVDMYAKYGLLVEAQEVFDELKDQDLVSWTALIASYAEHGLGEAAFDCFQQMQMNGVRPDAVTFVCILKACSTTGSITQGRAIHAEVVKEGLEGDPFIANSLMDLYVKCYSLPEAREVFHQLPVQDVVSWTALIAGYAEQGLAEEALNCYQEMQLEGVSPNAVTLVCTLRACGNIEAISQGKQIHDQIIKEGFERDLFVGSSLVRMYAKCGSLSEAEGVFYELPVRDVSSWNALILGCVEEGLGEEALDFSKQMQEEAIHMDAVTYVCSLKACGAVEAIDDGCVLHAEIVKRGCERDHFIGSVLVDMYVKCSLLLDARRVFDKLSVRDVVSWNSLTTGYVECGLNEEALRCLEHMEEEGVHANAATYACIFKLCGNIGAIHKGQELHSEIAKKGSESNQHAASALVGMYAKCGLLAEAQEVFDKIPALDLVLWNTLITGYAERGLCEETLNCLEQMQVPANAVTFVCSLKACKSTGFIGVGQKIHAKVVEEGYEKDHFVGSTLVDMYVNCGSISDAQEVFEELPVPDVFSWTALIAGYAEQGLDEEVLDCYEQMQLDGVSPDAVTMVCSLQACGSSGAVDRVREIHAELAKKGYEQDSFVGNHLVQMYAKSSSLSEAQEVFNRLPDRDVVSWTALITGYADKGMGKEVLHFLERMELEGVSPDAVTFVCSLRASNSIGNIDKGRELHAEITKKGFEGDPFIGNTLVGMYAKCSSVAEAREVFDRLAVQDVVSWTALMVGYSEQGLGEEAFNCFEQMQLEGVLPDVVSWNAVISGCAEQGQSDKAYILFTQMQEQGLSPSGMIYFTMMKACGNTAALDAGRRIHAQIYGVKPEMNEVALAAALIDMYGKCGSMVGAQQVFDAMLMQDLVTWNALIMGYTRQGESKLVFCMLERMREEGLQPDDVTFLSALTACSHVGLVDMGQKYFESMRQEYGIVPTIKHHNCLVDLLGRAGQVDEAIGTIGKMPIQADFVVWSTVLGACQKWGELDLGRQAFQHALRLDEKHAATFILMSNIFADARPEEDEGIVGKYMSMAGVTIDLD